MQNNAQIERKSQELAFALIRVAAYIRKNELKYRIDALSFKLVQFIAEGLLNESLPVLNALKNLVELGKNLMQIEPVNTKILLREIELLNQAIRQSTLPDSLPDLSKMFSDNQAIIEKPTIQLKIDSEVSKMRQEKIVEKIRQSGKIQLKDLIAEFPGISERTLRYDLKKLFDDGKLNRQGTGGPSNYYMLNSELSTPLPAGRQV